MYVVIHIIDWLIEIKSQFNLTVINIKSSVGVIILILFFIVNFVII